MATLYADASDLVSELPWYNPPSLEQQFPPQYRGQRGTLKKGTETNSKPLLKNVSENRGKWNKVSKSSKSSKSSRSSRSSKSVKAALEVKRVSGVIPRRSDNKVLARSCLGLLLWFVVAWVSPASSHYPESDKRVSMLDQGVMVSQ